MATRTVLRYAGASIAALYLAICIGERVATADARDAWRCLQLLGGTRSERSLPTDVSRVVIWHWDAVQIVVCGLFMCVLVMGVVGELGG